MNWNEYFIEIAKTIAKKSKDPSSQVGCVIIDRSNKIISTGYNGFIRKCNEEWMTYERPMKYNLIIHAEENAILFAKRNLFKCKLYCTHAPCGGCLKLILQSGIREIYYENNEPTIERGSVDQRIAIKRLLKSVEWKQKKEFSIEEKSIPLKCINLKTGDYYIDEIERSLK